tara:strand:+ start:2773 stop:3843 length:1071 start_codon:yes stop_codon:yes gene_type:complete
MKIRIKKLLKETTNSQQIEQIMSKYNIDVGKELGRGQYGQVFAGISDEHGPVAIKAVKRSGGSINEVPNYLAVSAARSKSPYIAKHFPEVYFVDEKSDRNYKYIVMEILEVQQGYQEELINILFGGLNTVLKPYEDEKEVSGTFRSRANRIYVLFKNKESQDSIYQDFYNALTPDLDFLLAVIKEFFAFLDSYVSNIKDNSESKTSLSFMMLSGKAEEYLYNFYDGSLKTLYKDAPWLLTFIVKQLEAMQKEDSTGSLFAQYHESIIRHWLEFYRKASPIGMKDEDPRAYAVDDKGLDKEKWQAFKEAASVKQAIKDLRQLAGIQAKDMHDGNVMIRPQTGDVVIVDLGLFKKIRN